MCDCSGGLSAKVMCTTLTGRFDQFLLGMLAAMWYRGHQVWLERLAPNGTKAPGEVRRYKK